MSFLMTVEEYCSNLGPLIKIVNTIINLIKWGIPILLVVFGMLDLGKAVMAGKEDEMKKAQSTLIKRVIYAVAVFLVVTLVTFIMSVVGDANTEDSSGISTDTTSWTTCLSQYK